MEGLQEVTSDERVVRVGERTFRLSPLRLKDFGEMERHVAASRPDPLSLLLPILPEMSESHQRHLLELAYDDLRRGTYVSSEELDQWMGTREGYVYRFWLSLRHHHPEIGIEEAEELLRESARDDVEMQSAVAPSKRGDRAEGVGPKGGSTSVDEARGTRGNV